MANRPVFLSTNKAPFYEEKDVSFQYYNGFSVTQKQRSIASLHSAFIETRPNTQVLEISTKSDNPLGKELSAFNLSIVNGDCTYSVETAFQSSKVFENGGPFSELLLKSSYEAKKDVRLRQSGPLVHFEYNGYIFPLEPKTFFYDWLYISALSLHPGLVEELQSYEAFTDIEFNPQKSLNCQARSAAIFVSLYRQNLVDVALKCEESFRILVYGDNSSKAAQLSLW